MIVFLFCKENSVFCSFCNEEFRSSKAMGDHLLMCGNKTDECPNCHKFIRRAVFAYHYENDCAEFDIPTTGDNKLCDFVLIILDCFIDKPRVTVKCEYCNQNFDKIDRKVHQVKIRKIRR